MAVTRWMLTALLTLAPAASALAEVPADALQAEQPDKKRRTYGMKELKEGLGTQIEAPEALVPWNHDRHGKAWAGRYYDADGRVFTSNQVHYILSEAVSEGHCEPWHHHLFDADRHRSALHALVIANGATGGNIGLSVMGPRIHHGIQAGRAIGRAAAAYSAR